MTNAMARLAQHDLRPPRSTASAARTKSVEMAAAVQVFKTSMIEADRLKEEQEQAQRLAAKRSALVDQLTREFDQRVQERGPDRLQPGQPDGIFGPHP